MTTRHEKMHALVGALLDRGIPATAPGPGSMSGATLWIRRRRRDEQGCPDDESLGDRVWDWLEDYPIGRVVEFVIESVGGVEEGQDVSHERSIWDGTYDCG